nr:MAG TPA: hypothetical protein [Caudoviricetes sp.]
MCILPWVRGIFKLFIACKRSNFVAFIRIYLLLISEVL